MRFRGHDYRVDWTHLIFITLITAFLIWYLFDARSVSLSVNNLLLVQPLTLFAVLMYLLIVPQCFHRADAAAAETDAAVVHDPLAPALPTERKELARVALLGLALGVFVFTLKLLGFDLAIWLFAVATMLICGERRPIPLVAYPLAITLVTVYGFRALMPYPMPTMLL